MGAREVGRFWHLYHFSCSSRLSITLSFHFWAHKLAALVSVTALLYICPFNLDAWITVVMSTVATNSRQYSVGSLDDFPLSEKTPPLAVALSPFPSPIRSGLTFINKPLSADGRSYFPRACCREPEPPSSHHLTSHAPIVCSSYSNRPATAEGLSRFINFIRLPVCQQPRRHEFPTSFFPYNTKQRFDWNSPSCMEWVRQLWFNNNVKGKALGSRLGIVSDRRWLIHLAYPKNVEDDGLMKPEVRENTFGSLASFFNVILDANNKVHEWARGEDIARESGTLAPADPGSGHYCLSRVI
jgi:hypothetical protein